MKLSTKTALIFLITTIVGGMTYVLAGSYLSDYLYQGETTRITGISSGCISRIEGEIGKLASKTKDYTSLVNAAKKLDNKYQVDGTKELGLHKKFEKDGIDYKILLNSDFSLDEMYWAPKGYNQEELEEIIKQVIPLVEDESGFVKGIVTTDKKPYFVGIDPVIQYPQKMIKGYFVLVDSFDQETVAGVGESMAKDMALVENYDKANAKAYSMRGGRSVDLLYGDTNVHSYYELPRIAGEKPYYIELIEPLVIRKTTDTNIRAVTIWMIVFSVMIYFILWKIIDKLVIKRLHKMSKEVNQIGENSNLKARLEHGQGKDEITQLCTDINKMVDALEDSHAVILGNEKKYSYLLQTMNSGFARYRILPTDDIDTMDAICEEVNQAFLTIYQTTRGQVIGKKISDFNYILKEYGDINFNNIINVAKKTGEQYTCGEVEILPGKWAEMTIYMIEEGYFTIILTDITPLKQYSQQMKYMAEYDGLTGLLNRYSLTKMMEMQEEPYALYFMDIDNFKDINDALGHNIGDEVLCEVAKQLKVFEDEHTAIARIGGDEFILIRKGNYSLTETTHFAECILQSINRNYLFGHYSFELSGSIGISCYPEHGTEQKNLLRYADIAMYKSKQQDGNSFSLFTNDMLDEIEIEGELREALKNHEIEAFYQPIYDVTKNEIIGAEALVRWIKNGEVIPPYKFLSVAKKTGDIVSIDQLILEKACRFCKTQREKGYEKFEVSVNASYRWLMQPGILERIEEVLAETGLPSRALKLEITEDEVIDNPKQVIKLLNHIKTTGIRISLDDFGVGYSSFNYIKMLPIDVLKIDRSLLLQVEEDLKTKSIIQTMINLSHDLNLEVVCEGVETQDQMDFLRTVQCDKIQGYFISRPIPEIEFNALIEKAL